MPEMPSRLQVGPVRYRITCDRAAMDRRRVTDGERYLGGYADHVTLTLDVDPDVPEDERRTILVHETLHALYHVYGLGEHPTDERHVEVAAYAWVDLLRRNPDLVAYLTAPD